MFDNGNDLKAIHDLLAKDAIAIKGTVVRLRRRLHQYPEISNQEFRTTALLKKELAKLGMEIHDGHAPTGLWADLDSGRSGPMVAVRTDIDGLEVTEETALPYASKVAGRMHACGHDAHMAMLVGAARLLAKQRKRLRGRVRFICQPAEEMPPGGARPLIAAGVLERPPVDVILASHVDPVLPTGVIGLCDGVSMASVYDFDLRVIGRSGHAALPHTAVDAITIAAEIITGLQQVVSRMIDPMNPAVISFGSIVGGQVRNAIAGEVRLKGTARSIDRALTRRLPRLIQRTAVGIGRAFGAKVEVTSISGFPVLVNDPRVNKFIAAAFRSVYPKGMLRRLAPIAGAEDFACYLERVPGAMLRLGVGNKRIGADKPWHHEAFMVDEEALLIGYCTMAATVVDLLHRWPGRYE